MQNCTEQHSAASTAKEALKSLCGCNNHAASKRMWTCILWIKYPFVSSTTSLCLCFSYPVPTISMVSFFPNPLPSISVSCNPLGWLQLTSVHVGRGQLSADAFSPCHIFSLHTWEICTKNLSAKWGHEVSKLLRG